MSRSSLFTSAFKTTLLFTLFGVSIPVANAAKHWLAYDDGKQKFGIDGKIQGDNAKNSVIFAESDANASSDTVIIGVGARATGQYGTAVGEGSQAQSLQSLALGSKARAIAKQATAVGGDSMAAGLGSIAIGADDLGNYAAIVTNGGEVVGRYTCNLNGGQRCATLTKELFVQNNGVEDVTSQVTAGTVSATDEDIFTDASSAGTKFYRVKRDGNKAISWDTSKNAARADTYKYSKLLPTQVLKMYGQHTGSGKTFAGITGYGAIDGSPKGDSYAPTWAQGIGAIVLGPKSIAYGNSSVAIGTMSFALGNYSAVLGSGSFAFGDESQAVGTDTYVYAPHSVGVGSKVQVISDGGMAFGYRARSAGKSSITLGTDVYADVDINTDVLRSYFALKHTDITALENKVASETDNLLKPKVTLEEGSGIMKVNPKTGSNNSIVIGSRSASTGNNSIVVGRGTFSLGSNNLALGSYAYTTGDNALAVGLASRATKNNTLAFGVGTEANFANSTAIGYNSVTDYTEAHLNKPGWVARGSFSLPSSSQVGIMSVGRIGSERRITNVAAGYRDTDAVNVAQLKTIEDRINNLGSEGATQSIRYFSVENRLDTTSEGAKLLEETSTREQDYKLYLRLKEQSLIIKARKRRGDNISSEYETQLNEKLTAVEAKLGNRINNKQLKSFNVEDRKYGNQGSDYKYDEVVAAIDTARAADETASVLTDDEKEALAEHNFNNLGAAGKNSIAIGYDANTTTAAEDAVAVGRKASATVNGGVALGANSVASTAAGAVGYDPATGQARAGNNPGHVWKATAGAVSVGDTSGNKTITRQITNVAAGTADTDAVNVAQLKQVTGGGTLNLKGDKNSSGSVNIKTQNLTIAGDNGIETSAANQTVTVKLDAATKGKIDKIDGISNSITTINDKIRDQKIAYRANDATAKSEVKLSDGFNFKNGTNTTAVTEANGVVKFSLNSALTGINSIAKTGGIKLNLGTDTLTFKTAANADVKLTGVANGTADNDAVNVSQLNEAKTAANSLTNITDAGKTVITNLIEADGQNGISVSSAATTGGGKKFTIGYNAATLASNLNIAYKASKADGTTTDKTAAKNTALSTGFDFRDTSNILSDIGDNGVVKFSLNSALTGIDSIEKTNGVKLTLGTDKLTFTTGAYSNTITFINGGFEFGDGRLMKVKKGVAETDAVNLAQLKALLTAMGGGEVNSTTGDVTVTLPNINFNKDGTKVTTGDTTGGTTNTSNVTNIKEAIEGVSKAVENTNSALDDLTVGFTADGGEASIKPKAPQKLSIKGAVNGTSNYIVTNASGQSLTIDLSESAKNSLAAADNAADKSLSNIDATGKEKITGLIDVTGSNGIKVTSSVAGDKVKTFAVTLDDTTKAKVDKIGDIETSISTINDKIRDQKIKYRANGAGEQSVKLSDGLDFTNGTNTTASVAASGVVKFSLNSDLTGIDSIAKTGGIKLNLGTDTLTFKTAANADVKLTGVANGTANNDAVNVSQLNEVKTTANNAAKNDLSNVTNLHNNAKTLITNLIEAEGENGISVTSAATNDGGKKFTIGITGATLANNVNIGYKADGKNAKTVSLTDGFNFTSGTNTTAAVKDNGEVTFDVNSTLKGITSIASSATENRGTKITLGDSNTITLVSGNAQAAKLTGVANGAANNDAVNVSQLTSLITALGGSAKIENGTITGPSYVLKTGKKDDNATGTYTTVGEALAAIDTALSKVTSTANNSSNTDLSNITEAGKNVITGLIDVKPATSSPITVDEETDQTTKKKTFKLGLDATKLNAAATIAYKATAKDQTDAKANSAKTTALSTGFNFQDTDNITATTGDNGLVKFSLKENLTGIQSIARANHSKITLDNGFVMFEGATTDSRAILKGVAKGTTEGHAVAYEQLKTLADSLGAKIATDGTITGPTINNIHFNTDGTTNTANNGGTGGAGGGSGGTGSGGGSTGGGSGSGTGGDAGTGGGAGGSTADNNKVSNIGDAINAIDKALYNTALNFTGDTGTGAVKLHQGDKLAVTGTANYVKTKADGTGLSIDLDDSVKTSLKNADKAADKDLSNLSETAKTNIKNLVKVTAATDSAIKVTEGTEGDAKVYTVDIKSDVLNSKASISYKSENESTAKTVTLNTGFNFKNGTNTTAVVEDAGVVKYDLNPALTGITSIENRTTKDGTTTGSKIKFEDGAVKFVGATDGKADGSTKDSTATLKGVKDGANDDEAVTAKQLRDALAKIGGGATVNTDGTIKAPSFELTNSNTLNKATDAEKKKSTVADALGALDKALGTLNTNLAETKIVYKVGNNDSRSVLLSTGFTFVPDSNNNISITESTANDGKINFSLNSNLTNITSIGNQVDKAGDKAGTGSKLTFGDDSVTLSGGNGAGAQLTGLKDGTVSDASKDAITGKQLHDNLSSVASALGGGSAVSGNKVTAPTYSLKAGEKTATEHKNVGAALSALDDALTKVKETADDAIASLDFGVAKDGADKVTLDKTNKRLNIVGSSNITTEVDAINKAINVKLNKDLTGLTSASFTDGKDPASTTVINGGSVVTTSTTKDGVKQTSTQSGSGFKATAGEGDTAKSSELTAGGLKVTDGTDTVNVTKDGVDGVTKIVGKKPTAADKKATEVEFTDEGLTLNDKTITGLADGAVKADSKDAINGKQLYNVLDSVKDSLGVGSVDPATGKLKNVAFNLKVGGDVAEEHTTVKSALEALDTGLGDLKESAISLFTIGADENKKAAGVDITSKNTRVDIVGKNNISTTVKDRTVEVTLNDTLNNMSAVNFTQDSADKTTVKLDSKGLDVVTENGITAKVGKDGLTISHGADADKKTLKVTTDANGGVITGLAKRDTSTADYGKDDNATRAATEAAVKKNREDAENGLVGTVIYTDKDGNRVMKDADGNYYRVNDRGEKIAGAMVDKGDLVLSLTNPDSSKDKAGSAVALNNVASGDISPSSNQAINGAQMNALNSIVGGDNISVDNKNKPSLKADIFKDITKADGSAVIAAKPAEGNNPEVKESGPTNVVDALNTINQNGTKYAKVNSTGAAAVAKGSESVAVGSNTKAEGESAVVIGQNASATEAAKGGVAIGKNAKVETAGSVALGEGSVAGKANTVTDSSKQHFGLISDTAVAGRTDANGRVRENIQVVSVGSKGNERQIQHVAPGVLSATSTDAVNGSQLYQTNLHIQNNSQRIEAVSKQVNTLTKDMRSGVASALAAANLPTLMQAGKTTIGVGAGSYQGTQAVAVGYSRVSDNGKVLVKFSMGHSGGNTSMGAGFGYAW